MSTIFQKSVLTVSITLISIFLTGCSRSAGGDNNHEKSPVQSASPQSFSSSQLSGDKIKSNCLIQSQRSVKLKAEIGGRIDTVAGAQGDFVKAGQILAKIDTVDLELESQRLAIASEQAQAKLALLEEQLNSAQRVWETLKPLYFDGRGAALPKEAATLKERQLDLATVKISIKDIDLQQKRVKRNISQAYIRSPMDGVVSLRNAEVGMIVLPGATSITGSDVLFEVSDPKNLRAECSARESDSPNIVIGSKADLRLDSSKGTPITLEISRVAPIIQNDSNSSAVLFWMDFQAPSDLFIVQGMHATATVEKKARKE